MTKHKSIRFEHESPLFASLAQPVIIKPYHHKPYRIRHLGWLLLALLVFFALTFQTGMMIGLSKKYPTSLGSENSPAAAQNVQIRSKYGFSLSYPSEVFQASGEIVYEDNHFGAAAGSELDADHYLGKVTLRPKLGYVSPAQAASQLDIEVKYGTTINQLRDAAGKSVISDNLLAAEQFTPVSTNDFRVSQVSTTETTLSEVPVQETIYKYAPRFDGGNTYTVVWAGVLGGRPFAVTLQGLVGSSATPIEYQALFASLELQASQKVAGINTLFSGSASAEAQKTFSDKYRSDLISPAVVKIYHLTCGILTVANKEITDDTCDGSSGSGFLVSSDGYVATNGHVVVFTAKDAFAEMLLHNPEIFAAFLRGAGLTDQQISVVASRPDLQAAILAKIYDLSDDDISLKNPKEATFVAIGSDPMQFDTVQDIRDAIDNSDADTIKRADIVATNYQSKDLYTLQSGNDAGFSSSDVALLKISVKNAPLIATGRTQVTQNEKITLLGFPGDAENQLVSRDQLNVSVTNGTVSSIREAAGNSGKLYQSDADASHGNSGGPAVDENDTAIGLLTYRFTTGDAANAAKSYIRDIADFNKLADDKHITFNTQSSTQAAWKKGLELMSANHYSAAIKQFKVVKKDYPTHRLADSYIAAAEQAIKDGKDVRDVPIAALIVGMLLSLAAVAAAVIVIARHHGKHLLYKAAGQTGTNVVPQDEHLLTTTQAKADLVKEADADKPSQVQ